MSGFIGSMLLAILGIVLYNLAQKLQPTSVNPFLILAIAYAIAALISLSLCFLAPWERSSVRVSLLPAACLAIAVVLTELGFLLVFRSGWDISIAGVVSTAVAALILIPVGIIFLKEGISKTNVMGVIVCLMGLLLTVK
ncbi:MAG: EamA family transporter [Leptolyngbyaceae cyanobacterium MO_188.B28]|nr:EamA family transporter [Leptolyngbyaceae cyanobacterium MO_188.B28]